MLQNKQASLASLATHTFTSEQQLLKSLIQALLNKIDFKLKVHPNSKVITLVNL